MLYALALRCWASTAVIAVSAGVWRVGIVLGMTRGDLTGRRPLPDPRQTPTVTVIEAGEILGIGKQTAYSAASHGDIPTLRLGRRLVVPTAKLARLLGADQAADVAG